MPHHPCRTPLQRTAALGIVATLIAVSAVAGEYRHFPGAPTDQRMQRVQQQVESLYDARDYARALLIYKRELAPAGDKYAQYMVGYMTLTGRGAVEDPARALAWYRLAAERNENPFVEARDALAMQLDPGAIERADLLFADLQQRLGDRRLLLDLLQKDLAALQGVAETSDGGAHGALVSGFLGGAPVDLRAVLSERMQLRLQYLDAMPRGADDDPGSDALHELEQSVRAAVEGTP